MPFLEAGQREENNAMQMLVRPIDSERDLCWVEEFNILAGELEEGIQGGEEVERCSPCLGPGTIRKLIDPRLPSQREVDEHNLTHLPYRNWCPICVRAKGKDLDHRVAVDREREGSLSIVLIIVFLGMSLVIS